METYRPEGAGGPDWNPLVLHVNICQLSAGLSAQRVGHGDSRSVLEQEGYQGICLTLVDLYGDWGKQGPCFSPASNAGCVQPWEVAESGLEYSLGFSLFMPGRPTVCPNDAGDTEMNLKESFSSTSPNLWSDVERTELWQMVRKSPRAGKAQRREWLCVWPGKGLLGKGHTELNFRLTK